MEDFTGLTNFDYSGYLIWGSILSIVFLIVIIVIAVMKAQKQMKLYKTFFKMSQDIEELNNKVEEIKNTLKTK